CGNLQIDDRTIPDVHASLRQAIGKIAVVFEIVTPRWPQKVGPASNQQSYYRKGATGRVMHLARNWRIMPKAGLEPACLAAPPPQDGVSANSTTSAKSLFLFRCRRRSRSVLLRRRLLRRSLLLLRLRRLLLRLRLILLPGAFANDGGAAGL